MAYVLSLQAHSPLKRSFSDNSYLQQCSPLRNPLLKPLGDATIRNPSACSLYSLNSSRTGDWVRGNENTPPLTSQSLLNLTPERNTRSFNPSSANDGPLRRSRAVSRRPLFARTITPANPYSRKCRSSQIPQPPSSSTDSEHAAGIDGNISSDADLFDLYDAIRVPLPKVNISDEQGDAEGPVEEETPAPFSTREDISQPFRRWMSTLRRRHAHRRAHEATQPTFNVAAPESDLLCPPDRSRGTSESMSSSMDFVTAMRSVSITIASTSIAPHPDADYHGRGRIGNRNSTFSDARKSLDSHRGLLGPVVDESA